MWTNLVPVLIYYGPAAVCLAQCTAPCTIARYRQRWREDKHIFHQQLLQLPCSHSLLSFPFSHRKPTRLSTTAEQTKLSSSGDFHRRVDEDRDPRGLDLRGLDLRGQRLRRPNWGRFSCTTRTEWRAFYAAVFLVVVEILTSDLAGLFPRLSTGWTILEAVEAKRW